MAVKRHGPCNSYKGKYLTGGVLTVQREMVAQNTVVAGRQAWCWRSSSAFYILTHKQGDRNWACPPPAAHLLQQRCLMLPGLSM